MRIVQKQERQWLLALDAVTGKEKWASDLAPAYGNAMGDGPRATPTLSDGTAYVAGYAGGDLIQPLPGERVRNLRLQ